MMNEVIVLFDGYSRYLDADRMDANCTCTLVKGAKNVIVDTMTAWDRDRLLDALAKNGLRPSDIDYVVSTHGHSDHTGNNHLFLDAEHIVGHLAHRGTIFHLKRIKQEDYELCEGVRVTATPGHTHEDVTVLVETGNGTDSVKYAITGDLFEREEDIADPSLWKAMGNPELEKIQASSRLRIAKFADYIVPGHGPMFKTDPSLVDTLDKQILNA